MPFYFHSCCFCFSRRGFYKGADHPHADTVRITKLASFKMVCNSETLFNWLLDMIKNTLLARNTCPFPTINRFHFSSYDREEVKYSQAEQINYLNKRCDLLQEETTKNKKQLRELASF